MSIARYLKLFFALIIVFASSQGPLEAQRLLDLYGSIPKGVILEGDAEGFEDIKTIKYDIARNTFILNKSSLYPLPIPRGQVAAIMAALAHDDRIGVSLAGRKEIVYGAIEKDSLTAQELLAADKILVSVVFGWTKNLKGINLPNNYKPQQTRKRKTPAICVNKFSGYTFELRNSTYYRSTLKMVSMLIPLSVRKASDGGYLPGRSMGTLSAGDLANLQELRANTAEYLKIPEINEAAAIGEVAAFARFLRDKGNLNLKSLVRHIMRNE